jgi:hypothetical protein
VRVILRKILAPQKLCLLKQAVADILARFVRASI